MLNTCVITAGGKGTRLNELTKNVPKPLFPIDNISCIERTLRLISNFEIINVYILTCYKQQLFKPLLEKLELELGLVDFTILSIYLINYKKLKYYKPTRLAYLNLF